MVKEIKISIKPEDVNDGDFRWLLSDCISRSCGDNPTGCCIYVNKNEISDATREDCHQEFSTICPVYKFLSKKTGNNKPELCDVHGKRKYYYCQFIGADIRKTCITTH